MPFFNLFSQSGFLETCFKELFLKFGFTVPSLEVLKTIADSCISYSDDGISFSLI